ncbi:MAG: carbohydrate kinase, YjeF related protein, partial [Humibacillus sp.]|nr:carbohydrate kinase, YjeF related protein [Humibacillus sp.]
RLEGDKNSRGTVLIIGGCRQNPGAVLLAAEAALRLGAGKVQIATTESTATQLATTLPEAFVEGLPESRGGEILPSAADRILQLADGVDAVLVGPGMGDPLQSALLLAGFVPGLDTTLVLDALATAYLTPDLRRVAHLTGRVVLTPNVTEVAATLQRDEPEVKDDLVIAATTLAHETGAAVLTGDETSYVAAPDGRTWSTSNGVPGLATAGSGDVRAGAVVSLCSRGASVEQAAVWAAQCHGTAGERLAARSPGFLARDIVRELPEALMALEAG